MKSSNAIARSAFTAHLLEINPCQSIEGDPSVSGDGGRARRLSKEAHFTDDRLRVDAPHQQAAAIVLGNVDGEFTGGDQIDGVGRLALTVKNLRTRDIFAFEVSKKIGGCDAAAELPLQPQLETGQTGIGVEMRRDALWAWSLPLGHYFRFVPYFVVGGFLAATG